MALDTGKLKTDLKRLYQQARDNNEGADAALDAFIEGMGDVIEAYVKSITITYTTGLSAPNGPVVGTFEHTIS